MEQKDIYLGAVQQTRKIAGSHQKNSRKYVYEWRQPLMYAGRAPLTMKFVSDRFECLLPPAMTVALGT
jgi:hypothetical protein